MSEHTEPRGFTIFRAKDAPGLMEAGCMTLAPMSDAQRDGLKKAVGAGYLEGDDVKILVNLPRFSVAHAWLKKDYPLALHSHDSDCLYHIVAGSLRLGTEDLGARDSFFVPAGTPYTYRPGPDGVEVLEFRHQGAFNFVNLSKSATFWDKAAQTIATNVGDWREAVPPSMRPTA
jgi:mannose-6-phosphate isomerase-like protein (cupin superfamily)